MPEVIICACLWKSNGQTGGCYCIQPVLWLSEVQSNQSGSHSFCAGETFISSPGPETDVEFLSSNSFLSHPLIGPKRLCNTKKLRKSLRRCLAIFHSWNITLLSVTSCLWDSTEPALCLHLTSVFTYLPFEKPLLCAALMSTILPSETAAAVCIAWSYLWLHAASVELAGDRSSHSGRLIGDNRSISDWN